MKPSQFLGTLMAIFIIFTLLIFPKEMLAASSSGLSLWFKFVLPSLFPFMVATGILLRQGAAHMLGKLLQPIMKPLFDVSGICAFPFFLGLLSGYPMGAKITVMLYEEGNISLSDAKKTLAFANNPGPLFVVGTVGCALLNSPYHGYLIMISIFLSSLSTGILFRFFFTDKNKSKKDLSVPTSFEPIGVVLSKSVADAIETILQIGGFIILFSVIIEALSITNIFSIFIHALKYIFPFSETFLLGILGGILEMTNGAAIISSSSEPFFLKLLCITGLLSFGGLSIFSQTLGILKNLPINPGIYILYKIINSLFSMSYLCILNFYILNNIKKTVPVMELFDTNIISLNPIFSILSLAFLLLVLIWSFFKSKYYE